MELADTIVARPAPVVALRPPAGTVAVPAADAAQSAAVTLGVGDAIKVQVYGKPELETTTYVGADGTVPIPLAGTVAVLGQSPAAAGQSIAAAFRKGGFLIDPQVTVFMVQFRSQQVTVLGAVRTPGRFTIETRATLLDVLAQAGGIDEDGASNVVLLRPDKAGKLRRYPIDLAGLGRDGEPVSSIGLQGGDSIFVPPAPQFYIKGEVSTPNMYRLEPGMTVEQAISRGGGVTARGSSGKVEIRRRKPDGGFTTRSGSMTDAVEADDVIRVRERIF